MSYLGGARARAARSRGGAAGMGDSSILDTVLGVLTLGATTRQRNRERPYQAVAEFFSSYGRQPGAPYLGAKVMADGELVSQELPDLASARAWMATPGILYGATWDVASNSMIAAGGGTLETSSADQTAANETIVIRDKPPASRWWILAVLAGGAYLYSRKR